MNPLRTFSQDRTRFVAALFALVLLARLLVPAGWMPSAQDGRWISICSGSGEAMVWIDADGTAHADKDGGDQHKDGSCVFSAASLAFSLPAAPFVVAALPAYVAAPVLALPSVAIGRGLAAPPPPKTGPPVLN
jgi:hypothetical protein